MGVAQRSNRGSRIPILVANAVSTKVIEVMNRMTMMNTMKMMNTMNIYIWVNM